MASNAPPAPGSQHSARFISLLFILRLLLTDLLTCSLFHFSLSLCTPAPLSSLSSPDTLLYSPSREADLLPASLSLHIWPSKRFRSAPSWPAMRSPQFAWLASLAINNAVSCRPAGGAVTRTGQVQIRFFCVLAQLKQFETVYFLSRLQTWGYYENICQS